MRWSRWWIGPCRCACRIGRPAQDRRLDRRRSLIETAATQFNKADKSKGVTAGQYAGVGSGAGIAGANVGTYDVGGSSRDARPTDPEGPGVHTDLARVDRGHRRPKNPVCQKGLSAAQVEQLFSGTASQRRAVGGGAGAVDTLDPRLDLGHAGQLRDAVPEGRQGQGLAAVERCDPQQGQERRQRVGAVTGAYIEGFKGVCGVKIDGVAPTLKNVSNGKFKFWTFQYLVTKGAPAGDAKAFVDFARSKPFQTKYVSKFAVPVGNAPAVNT